MTNDTAQLNYDASSTLGNEFLTNKRTLSSHRSVWEYSQLQYWHKQKSIIWKIRTTNKKYEIKPIMICFYLNVLKKLKKFVHELVSRPCLGSNVNHRSGKVWAFSGCIWHGWHVADFCIVTNRAHLKNNHITIWVTVVKGPLFNLEFQANKVWAV